MGVVATSVTGQGSCSLLTRLLVQAAVKRLKKGKIMIGGFIARRIGRLLPATGFYPDLQARVVVGEEPPATRSDVQIARRLSAHLTRSLFGSIDSQVLIWSFVILGIAIRARQYLFNRSLWL